MADKYWFEGGFLDIQGITISPNTSVRVEALCYYNAGGITMKFVNIEGDEYNNWGSDDNYLICLVGHKLGMGKRVQVVSNTGDVPPQDIGNYDFGLYNASTVPSSYVAAPTLDNRSVHNEADIQRIQTLQEQLDSQAAKLKTITDMLIGKGLV